MFAFVYSTTPLNAKALLKKNNEIEGNDSCPAASARKEIPPKIRAHNVNIKALYNKTKVLI